MAIWQWLLHVLFKLILRMVHGFTSPSLAAWCSRRPPNSSFHSAIPIENGDFP